MIFLIASKLKLLDFIILLTCYFIFPKDKEIEVVFENKFKQCALNIKPFKKNGKT